MLRYRDSCRECPALITIINCKSYCITARQEKGKLIVHVSHVEQQCFQTLQKCVKRHNSRFFQYGWVNSKGQVYICTVANIVILPKGHVYRIVVYVFCNVVLYSTSTLIKYRAMSTYDKCGDNLSPFSVLRPEIVVCHTYVGTVFIYYSAMQS